MSPTYEPGGAASAMAIDKIGQFQILGTLGKGAHSTILHVRRSADAKQYALKIVPIQSPDDHKFLEQAEHEFLIAQKLDHPNLIKVYALEKLKKFLGSVREVRLLIEYVNGKTLDTFKIIPLPQLVQIFEHVANGLVHMHRRNIYHADLKPNNIMLSKTGEVKVIDYGLAWMKGENKARVQGTPEYMAPEQIKNRIANEQTDIFNLGATMYRMVTFRNIPSIMGDGSVTLDGKTWAKNLKPVLDCNPKAPKVLAHLIEHCIAYKASERPERIALVHEELERVATALKKSPDDELEAMEWQS